MKEKYAISLGLPISQNATCEITIGSGNQVTTTGTATVPFRLSSENEVHNLEFQLLPNCIHDVIIGKPFLKLTRTFSNVVNFYRRVKKRFAKGISQFHLLYLGASTPMFEGSINGQVQSALADSSSKVLIMDKAYARSIGVHIHTRHEYQTRLKFADNSVTETAGMAYDVEWRFGHDDEFTSPYPLDFHILKNAPANVVLSDSFLFDTKAFPQYCHYLIDDDDDCEDEDVLIYFFLPLILIRERTERKPIYGIWNLVATAKRQTVSLHFQEPRGRLRKPSRTSNALNGTGNSRLCGQKISCRNYNCFLQLLDAIDYVLTFKHLQTSRT
ncbi:unnamed protein product [Penicillium roqueforti FM164]|uniref:Genomic scaffold, ProqFM164S02 n=1 Tax=Penicillium roqueforti (strain FM164) TaxID=1365484 RepID=W6Q7Y9_PENRF|nr:unnamed protein product [Penicillium roqueforti FM164]